MIPATCRIVAQHVKRRPSTRRTITSLSTIVVVELFSIAIVEVIWWHVLLAVSLFAKDLTTTVLDALAEALELD